MTIRLLPRRWVPELDAAQPRQIDLHGVTRVSANPRLGYELQPGGYEINDAGYRGPLYPETTPHGVFRIVGIGDSTAFGLGVSDAQTYLRRLEASLNAAGEGPIQVVNLAVGGYDAAQEFEMLRSRGLAFEPDLVILGYDHNDTEPILGRIDPPVPEDYGRNVLHSEVIRFVLRRFYSQPHFLVDQVDGYVAGGPAWDAHLEAHAEIARLCRERGIPVLVVVYDAWVVRERKAESVHYHRLHEPLRRAWREHGFHVVDGYDVFQEVMRERGWDDIKPLWVSVEPRDGHPNPSGHALLAEAIQRKIRENGLLRRSPKANDRRVRVAGRR